MLFETSKEPFFEEFLANIREVCDPASLDYIVVNHTEPDHTGSMKRLLELAPGATVLGSGTALTFLKEIVNGPFPSRAVTEKDEIDLGGLTMNFLSVPMLHWPDSMYTYIPELKALFTCDSFGCHYADPRVFNDLIDGDFTPRTNIISTTSSGRSKTRSCAAHWIRSAACPWSLWATATAPCCAAACRSILTCTAPGAGLNRGRKKWWQLPTFPLTAIRAAWPSTSATA